MQRIKHRHFQMLIHAPLLGDLLEVMRKFISFLLAYTSIGQCFKVPKHKKQGAQSTKCLKTHSVLAEEETEGRPWQLELTHKWNRRGRC